MDLDKTMFFKMDKNNETDTKKILKVGYILSGDPTYITSHNDARTKIRSVERDELLEKMVKYYIGLEE